MKKGFVLVLTLIFLGACQTTPETKNGERTPQHENREGSKLKERMNAP